MMMKRMIKPVTGAPPQTPPSFPARRALGVLAALATFCFASVCLGQIATPNDARKVGMESLHLAIQKDGGVPLPPNLDDFVCDRQAAIQLGKALYWDMQVGSDGIQACASCHFHAGADNRSKNQLNPGILRVKNTRPEGVAGDVVGYFASAADPDHHFELGAGPNFKLRPADFPFIRTPNRWVQLPDGTVAPDTASGNRNDISSSQGVFLTRFDGVHPGFARDYGTPLDDPVFNVRGVTVRRVEPRNTPTVFNAIFNFASFLDGRANHHFNGATVFGIQDLNARIFVNERGSLCAVRMDMENASLASQAVGPPVSFFEMSFGDGQKNFRTWPEIGKKLLDGRLVPLGRQQVHCNDSVLGPLAKFPGRGLKVSYETLITKAFHRKYWNSKMLVYFGQPWLAPLPAGHGMVINGGAVIIPPGEAVRYPSDKVFTQMQANFSMFFGIALMLYESTLVTDRTPFDRWMETGVFNEGFGPQELAGLNIFGSPQRCLRCHGGPELTNASIRSINGGTSAILAMSMSQGVALYDKGFYNLARTLTTDDPGRGGADPFGRPLAFSRQFGFENLGFMPIPFPITGGRLPLQVTLADGSVQPVGIDKNGNGFIDVTDTLLIQRVAVDGAFKTPSPRGALLTGPFFHDGGAATLRQLVEAYDHGQNFSLFNIRDFDPGIRNLNFTEQQTQDLVAFLIALNDPRPRIQSAPFDHPQLYVPNGHPGNQDWVLASCDGQALDDLLTIPAVGAAGDPCHPLQPYLNLDPRDGNPEGNVDAYATKPGKNLTVPGPGVLANDHSIIGKPLSAALFSTTRHGSLTLDDHGGFVYCPERGFTGQDRFLYVALTDTFNSDPTTVTLTVGPPRP